MITQKVFLLPLVLPCLCDGVIQLLTGFHLFIFHFEKPCHDSNNKPSTTPPPFPTYSIQSFLIRRRRVRGDDIGDQITLRRSHGDISPSPEYDSGPALPAPRLPAPSPPLPSPPPPHPLHYAFQHQEESTIQGWPRALYH